MAIRSAYPHGHAIGTPNKLGYTEKTQSSDSSLIHEHESPGELGSNEPTMLRMMSKGRHTYQTFTLYINANI
jgi:hypothetical protein